VTSNLWACPGSLYKAVVKHVITGMSRQPVYPSWEAHLGAIAMVNIIVNNGNTFQSVLLNRCCCRHCNPACRGEHQTQLRTYCIMLDCY
jgi:hypothetical protein